MNALRHRVGSNKRRHLSEALLLAVLLPAGTSAQDATDARLRAAFLFNFIQYVEWPSNPVSTLDAPLLIGIYQDPELAAAAISMVEGRTVGGRTVAVRVLSRPDQVEDLFVLYVGSTDPLEIARGLNEVEGRPVLTVGYADGFAARGGMINFVLEDRRMKFEVNRKATEESGLRLSSQLLRLARIVGDGAGPRP